MSCSSTLLNCPDVQLELNSFFQTCNINTLGRESTFLTMVTSPENTSGINQIVNPGGAKTRTVILRYDQGIPVAEVEEVEECNLDCGATTQRGDASAEYSMNICEKIKVSEGYNVYDLANICRSNQDFIAARLNAMAGALEQKLAQKTAEEAVSLVGKYAEDVLNVTGDVLEVQTKKNDGSLNPYFLPNIDLASKQTGYCAPIGIFGGAELYLSTDLLNVGCCSVDGIDLMGVMSRYGKAVAWDPYIVSAFSSNDISLMTQIGAMQLLTYTVGSEASFSPLASGAATNFEVIPLVTPRYGIPVDLTVSNNCGQLSLVMTTSTKLVAMPFDMFCTGPYTGVNFVNLIQVTNS
jgi:hypothetical protein